MTNGRKPTEQILERRVREPDDHEPNPDFDPNYRVPMLKIVIGDDRAGQQRDARPNSDRCACMPKLPSNLKALPHADASRWSAAGPSGGEIEWLINGLRVRSDCATSRSRRKGSAEVWTIQNGGGGWVHPMHIHQEEHRVISRNGVPARRTRRTRTTPARRTSSPSSPAKRW